jgi:hypothetical protein|tara:strand:+ start:1000 stop:1314 length:315 start_codon:yes stop_codon:yes gene_type:complete
MFNESTILILIGLGVGVGGIAGFCIKHFCFSDMEIHSENDTDSELSSFDTHDYVKYLENMLNDSTIVTTESVSLQPVDVDSQNITPEIVHAIEVTPSAPYLSQV